MVKDFKTFYYSAECYCCPNCGTPDTECEPNGNWGYICSECGTDFETPDV